MPGRKPIGILFDAIFPPRCLICDAFINQEDSGGRDALLPSLPVDMRNNFVSTADAELLSKDPASWFSRLFHHQMSNMTCESCRSLFVPVHSPLCTRCGEMFQSRSLDDHECGLCINTPKYFHKARAFGVYDQSLMELIHCFKYKGKIQLARSLGAMMRFAFWYFWKQDRIDLMIPVPLHRKRFRKRGFNQAYLLVKHWDRMTSETLSSPPVETTILSRHRRTDPQTGLGRKERIRNIQGAFRVNNKARVRHKHVLLVDDVYTTGATANACAKTLLAAGADRVDVLTLARAV